ncbi:phosphoribosylglycinamide formyltransferase [bacterium]|jgi:phosphoribosylglycinamide formyltransferase 1|nr:phosphoribosylglycinamide formyltransferase [bacterium]MBT4552133.1 phosphoribosylglycinamide formyltransferase [bacterium]MBT5988597.1 phosphoribosylglycinamide formyltransferase [bacterium]
MTKLKLGFLASHGGSNMQAIIDACKNKSLNAEACVVISNNSDAFALQRAQKENIPAYHLNSKTHPHNLDQTILSSLQKHKINLVVLAGYMKKISPVILAAYKNHILNIHPALLPKFGGPGLYGLKVHAAVLAANSTESGATVHLVDEIYDHGRILNQVKVPVLPNDTPETLAQRVLVQEHQLYPETLRKISKNEIIL